MNDGLLARTWAYRIIDPEALLHTPCNTRVPVGTFEYVSETKTWVDTGDDSVHAAIMAIMSHELECEHGEAGTTEDR